MRWIAVGCVLVCLGLIALQGSEQLRHESTAVAQAHSSKPSHEPVARRVFAAGVVEGTQRETSLQFEITGRLKAVHVQAGEAVEAGTLLAELDAELLELKHQEAIAQWKLAKAEFDRLVKGATPEARKSARTSARAVELQLFEEADALNQLKLAAPKGSVSSEKLDQARARYAKVTAEFNALRQHADLLDSAAQQEDIAIAEAKVEVTEAAIRQAEAMLSKSRLLAPITGTVLQVGAELGELVGPQALRPLLTQADLSTTRVRCYVEEFDALRVAVGQAATAIADGQPGVSYAGQVVSCAGYVSPKQLQHLSPGERHDLRVREVVVELQKTEGLLIGLPVEVFIVPGRSSREG